MIWVKFIGGGKSKFERRKLVLFDLFNAALSEEEKEEEKEIEIQVTGLDFNTLLDIIDGTTPIQDVEIPLLKQMLLVLGYLGNGEWEDKICRQIGTRASQLSYKDLKKELQIEEGEGLSYVLDSG